MAVRRGPHGEGLVKPDNAHSMSRRSQSSRSAREARADLVARLRDRLPELEAEVLNRIGTIGTHSSQIDDPEYRNGQRRAVRTALKFGIDTVEVGERRVGDAPVTLRSQARLAARHGVGVGVVHRRYVAGKHVLARALREDASRQDGLRGADLEGLLSSLEVVFDRLAGRIEEEYEHEVSLRPGDSRDQLAERVEQLLAGELVDTSDLNYDFDAHHIGAVAGGGSDAVALRALAKAVDGRLLTVRPRGDVIWTWIGTRRRVDPEDIAKAVASRWPTHVPLGLGEPGVRSVGWRVTHRQALDAWSIGLRGQRRVVRYADVALDASMMRDDLLAAFLRQTYLDPLSEVPDDGGVLCDTLRAFFAAQRNVSSAASALGVKRHTVTSRLRRVEERLGRPLPNCSVELEVALRLENLSPANSFRNVW